MESEVINVGLQSKHHAAYLVIVADFQPPGKCAGGHVVPGRKKGDKRVASARGVTVRGIEALILGCMTKRPTRVQAGIESSPAVGNYRGDDRRLVGRAYRQVSSVC